MRTAGVREARQNLSALLDEVKKGREIVIDGRGDGPEASRTLVVEVDLAPGPYELAVGVLDYQGGGEAHLRARVEVSAPPAPPAESAQGSG